VARLGVDGPVESDTAGFADLIAAALTDDAVPVARVSARYFLRARSIRLEHGRDDPDACYDLWYDVPALRREVLDAVNDRGTWLPRLRDPETDRSVRAAPQPAPPGGVVVLDGRFLLRDDVRTALDLTVHLSVSPAARERRGAGPAVRGAWERYLNEEEPERKADVVLRFDHPDRPADLTARLR
jgi:uridine kinase